MTRSRDEITRELAGYLTGLVGLLVLLSLVTFHPLDPSPFAAGSDTVHNLLSHVGATVAGVLVALFGVPAVIVPFLMFAVGWTWLHGRDLEAPRLQSVAWLAAVAFADGLLAATLHTTAYRGGQLAWGGELGTFVLVGLDASLGRVGTVLVCLAGAVAGVVFGVRGSLAQLVDRVDDAMRRKRSELAARRTRKRELRQKDRSRRELLKRHVARHPGAPQPGLVAREVEGEARLHIRRLPDADLELDGVGSATTPAVERERVALRQQSRDRKSGKVIVQEVFEFVRNTPVSPLPEKTMLLPAVAGALPDPEHLAVMREMLEGKCREFRVEGQVVDVLPGPVITTYEFRPAAGIKYAQVVALEDDLAMGLKVEAVRIERMAGRATVGIEVPNPDRGTIVLREIVESSKFVHSASPLTLALGTDIHGRPFVADLQRMPHLLIGGFTGSGKSVGINSMIMSMLFKATPEQVRFILIDPKMVELGMYEKLPHLLTPIISDSHEAARALRWTVREMRERYALLAACKVRNLAQYNTLLASPEARQAATQLRGGEELKPLPLIVVIIDELADLMMTCAREVEDSIGHLSQMARAVGIHLIFATQRPSVDIITGVIKANFPCRIAYKVRTRFDSRTILDSEGAECLLGMGDMLFLPPGTSRPLRLHGCLVREEEILTVLKHLRRLGRPEFDERVLAEPEPGHGGDGAAGTDDPMYEQAARLVVTSRKASASFIQRKLRLGYARSARLLDIMEQEGLVGPAQGSRGREVLVSPDYFAEVEAGRAPGGGEGEDDA